MKETKQQEMTPEAYKVFALLFAAFIIVAQL